MQLFIYDTVLVCVNSTAGFSFTQADEIFEFQNNSQDATGYFWDFGDGANSTLENPDHIYQAEGQYLVCLTTESNCINDSTCQTINFLITGADNYSSINKISIVPNPANTNINIRTEIIKGAYVFRDITGKTLLQGTVTSPKFTLDISTLSSGVYFITVSDGERQVNGKVVKE